ncbi:MAG: HIT family protein [Candidatus Coatesbacteria bacterium]
MKKGCAICERLALWRQGSNTDVVREFNQSVLVIGMNQHFRGYALLLLKRHVREPHQLPPKARRELFEELMRSADAVWRCFKPWKLNYACYGNAVPHMHWHIIPRKVKGPPPWLVREFREAKPASEAHRTRLARRLRRFM